MFNIIHKLKIKIENKHVFPIKLRMKKTEIDYATSTTLIDTFVGEIMNTLKQTGLDNNTIVFYASDNGANNEGGVSYTYFASSGYLSGILFFIIDYSQVCYHCALSVYNHVLLILNVN